MKKALASISLLLLMWVNIDAQQLVLPGDHPDPSVVKINNEYWATATTSNWFPAFPLMSSTDLVHWNPRGHVFDNPPEWADYYFWAPEITYDKGKVWVYYSAHKKGGNLCIAAASADRPGGPYTDHGPLVCQADGSIDAFAFRDETGQLYLIWKEDGNSVGKPTPIWARAMNEERTGFTGEAFELFRNDLPWEGNLVEGVSIIRHGSYLYAFYAADGCCGSGCNYVMGVARAKTLSGKWEKMNAPLFTGSAQWKCPGHGTAVEKDGRFYFLYHGYSRDGGVYTGREGLLSEFRFNDDQWISLIPDSSKSLADRDLTNEFENHTLPSGWEWSVFNRPQVQVSGGQLRLQPTPGTREAFIGQKLLFSNYEINTSLRPLTKEKEAGLALIGDDKNMLMLTAGINSVQLVRRMNGIDSTLAVYTMRRLRSVFLRITVKNGTEVVCAWSRKGKTWTQMDVSADAGYLPPWDRALRAGLYMRQTSEAPAAIGFDRFEMKSN